MENSPRSAPDSEGVWEGWSLCFPSTHISRAPRVSEASRLPLCKSQAVSLSAWRWAGVSCRQALGPSRGFPGRWGGFRKEGEVWASALSGLLLPIPGAEDRWGLPSKRPAPRPVAVTFSLEVGTPPFPAPRGDSHRLEACYPEAMLPPPSDPCPLPLQPGAASCLPGSASSCESQLGNIPAVCAHSSSSPSLS